jgi:hypothetical protein
MMKLYHISHEPDITAFEPRPNSPHNPLHLPEPAVWAIGRNLLHNYLFPRDCPRVTFYTLPESDPADVERFFGHTAARYIVAIESRWLDAVRNGRLYCYELPPETFTVIDEGAGYYISRQPIVPLSMRTIDDLLGELAQQNVELRITPSLWPLRDAVLNSTLQFSFIRMRNATPPG